MTAPWLLLRGGTVVDAVGGARAADVLVHGDTIEAVGPGLEAPADAEIRDVAGRFVAPGLCDAHVHLMNVPGDRWLDLDDAGRRQVLREQLAAYVAAGVTTVLDTGALPDALAAIRALAEEGPAPRILSLGPPLGPTGGYPSRLEPRFPSLGGPADVGPALDGLVDGAAVGVKVTFERGFAPRDDWPILSEDTRRALREEAAARDLPIFVHAMSPPEFVTALDLAPRAFVHAPEAFDRRATSALAAAGPWVVTTLTVYDAAWPLGADRLADPLYERLVPAPERALVADRARVLAARAALADLMVPWAPRAATRSDAAASLLARTRLRRSVRAVRALHDAGVPLVLGTDSGTWPLLVGQFHGLAALREAELLAEAGLSPAEVLRAGTAEAADLLGRRGAFGVVAPGAAADLVVLEQDPLASASAWRTAVLTVRAGDARTPQEWVSAVR